MDNQEQAAASMGNSQEQKQTARPVFVGRITLGLALIAVGLLVTASLFSTRIPFLTVAKFAPLILVVLGAEILFAAARHRNQTVKVGFGLTLLCLILIFGAVAAGVLPEFWEAYGPGHWQEQQRIQNQAERTFYSQVDSSTVEYLHIYLSDENVIYNVDLDFSEPFASKEDFAKAAAEAVHVLADMDADRVSICGQNEKERWNFSLAGAYSQGEITEERLLKIMDTQVLPELLTEEP